MSKTRIPSPARSHGASTPRRYRPLVNKTRSVASPGRSSRLTSIIKNAFQLSHAPTRRSVLNDDTDIQEPLYKSWWKNINENSRDMQELYKNINSPVVNNVLEDINTEASSPEQNFSIHLPDSSDGESIISIKTPKRKKLFYQKEIALQSKFKNSMKIIQQNKKTSLKSTDSDESINVSSKKLFKYTKEKSVPIIPPELLQNLKKDSDSSFNASIEMQLRNKKSHNLFGNKPDVNEKSNRLHITFNKSMSDSEEELNEQQVFGFKRPSSVRLYGRSSMQSDIDEEWHNHLPSSTMIEHQPNGEMTPNNRKHSLSTVHFHETKRSRLMSKENVMDNAHSNKDENMMEPENPEPNIPTHNTSVLIRNNSNEELSLENSKQSFDIENAMDNTLITDNNENTRPELNKTLVESQNTPVNNNLVLNNSLINNKSKSLNNSVNDVIKGHKNSILDNNISEKPVQVAEIVNIKSNNAIVSQKLTINQTRISETQSDSSTNNSVWDSHRVTRKTLRQTFGKDFTPRKSLRTLVMEKSAKRHTVSNIKNLNINDTNKSIICQTNNAHNKTVPSRCHKLSENITQNISNLELENYQNKQLKEITLIQSINQEDVMNEDYNDRRQTEEIQHVVHQSENGEHILKTNENINSDTNNQTQDKEEIKHQLDVEEQMERSNNADEEHIEETSYDKINDAMKSTEDEEPILHPSDDEEQIEETSYDNTNDAMKSSEDKESTLHQLDDEEQIEKTIYDNTNDAIKSTESEEPTLQQSDNEEQIEETSHDNPNESIKLVESEEHTLLQSSNGDQMSYIDNETFNQIDDYEQTQEQESNENEASKETDDEEQIEEMTDDEADSQIEEEIEDQSKEQSLSYDQEQMRETENDDENESVNEINDNISDERDNENIMVTNNDESDEDDESTHNYLHNNEDISQMPQANSTENPVLESMSTREAVKQLKKNKQSMHAFIEQIKIENAKRKQRLDAEVGGWLKNLKPQNTNTFFKVPQKPAPRMTTNPTDSKPKKPKPTDKMFLNILPKEFFEDIKYKPPKRYQPKNASWANKHLYAFLEKKLEPKYDYKARVRAEKLVEKIYQFTQDIRRFDIAPEPAVLQLKQEMARLKVVATHFDFYQFIIDYLPQEIRHKVVPSGVNLIPLPMPSIYSNIFED